MGLVSLETALAVETYLHFVLMQVKSTFQSVHNCLVNLLAELMDLWFSSP